MSDAPDTPEHLNEAREVARLFFYFALLALSVTFLREAWNIPVSRFEAVGAGAFPMIAHGALILLLLSGIVKTVWMLPATAYRNAFGAVPEWLWARRLVLVLFVCLGIYIAAMPMVGYSLATLVFLMVLQLSFSPRTWKALGIASCVAVTFSFGLNWVFAEMFLVFLPRGV
ncbi:MAG: tripartite tricarboxylate transporter TctB family protein [Roseinatronobacter sp.]